MLPEMRAAKRKGVKRQQAESFHVSGNTALEEQMLYSKHTLSFSFGTTI